MRVKFMDSSIWLLIYSMLWFLLSDNSGWYMGVPLVFLATFLAAKLRLKPWYLRAHQLLPFSYFFLKTMLAGAWDVARRALHPRSPLDPAWVSYTLQSQDPRVRSICSAVVGLLPGSLASHIDEQKMHLHVLDQRQDWHKTLGELEQRLERLLSPSAGNN